MEIKTEIEIIDWLMSKGLNFAEAAIVLEQRKYTECLGQSIMYVFHLRNSHECE